MTRNPAHPRKSPWDSYLEALHLLQTPPKMVLIFLSSASVSGILLSLRLKIQNLVLISPTFIPIFVLLPSLWALSLKYSQLIYFLSVLLTSVSPLSGPDALTNRLLTGFPTAVSLPPCRGSQMVSHTYISYFDSSARDPGMAPCSLLLVRFQWTCFIFCARGSSNFFSL